MALPRRLTDAATARQALLALLPDGVPSQRLPAAAAIGRVAAETLTAPRPMPRAPVAARDGWAVASVDTQGAGSYSPASLPPNTAWIASGAELPEGADAVLPEWAATGPPFIQAIEPFAPGEGVRLPGEDVAGGTVLCRAGEMLRATHLPALHLCNIDHVAVRAPRVALVCCGDELDSDPGRDGIGPFLATLLRQEGSVPSPPSIMPDRADRIADALVETAATSDLVLLVGGTGVGRDDFAAEALARAGRLVMHGLASRPGESTGFGLVATTPVLLVPGRWEDAIAAFLVLVRPAVRRLTLLRDVPRSRASLTRKVASAVGLLDLVPVRWVAPGRAEPLAVGAMPAGVMAAADAVLLVPPDTEGYDAGAEVELELL